MEGKVVLVTGASMGIGRHAARTFAQEGAKVAVADIAPLDKVDAELGELGADVLTINADVRREARVKAMVDRVIRRFGRIDVLVNNAAIVTHFMWGIPRWPRIPDLDKSFWDKVINTNLTGTFLCTKHVLPHMESQRSGHIINLHGGGGVGTTAAAYSVSKDAIRTFTRFAAGEVRDSNVRVVIVSPGSAIATENAPEEARRRMPGPESLENVFVLAAQVGMDLSGQVLQLKDGKLITLPW
jgi:NAD(P)-dependent dehydrogenase (short-subunit alcohol dehydrogenase family)